jgi:hypothetical protein
MRQLIVQVPRGQGKEVLDIVKSLNGVNLAQLEAKGDRQLLWRSIVRYFAALAVTIAVAGALSLM